MAERLAAEPASAADPARARRRAEDRREWLGVVSRFGLVGIVNSAVGFLVIAELDVGLHLPPSLANALVYGVGICIGYVLNRSFVFRSEAAAISAGPKYLAVVLAAFALNQAVLKLAGLALGAGAAPHLAAQLCAMASYTVSSFVAFRFWVFRAPPRA